MTRAPWRLTRTALLSACATTAFALSSVGSVAAPLPITPTTIPATTPATTPMTTRPATAPTVPDPNATAPSQSAATGTAGATEATLAPSVTLAPATPPKPRTALPPDPAGQLHRHRYDARTGSNPKQVAFNPAGTELWVPLLGSFGVDVFRASDGVKLTTINVGGGHGAVEVIFNGSGTRAYVSQMETASVYEIDTSTRKVLRRMATTGNWTKVLALSPDEKTLYAANWVSNDISVIDLSTGVLKQKIPTVKTPRGLVLDKTGSRIFVAGFDGGEIQRITLATGEKKTLLRTDGAMRHMVPDYNAGVIYVDDMATSKAYVVDLNTEAVRVLSTTDSHPNTIDLSPDAKVLYVSNRGENNAKGYNIPGPEWGSVLMIDTATGALLDAIIGGNQTTGLDVSPDGKMLAFTDFLDNRLAVYDIPPADVLANGKGGLAPNRRALIVKKK